MRLYDGKILDRALDRRFRSRTWGRDAIVWDIDTTNKLVRCKIQGSDEYILCHYPRNWQTLPTWCKRGNAVRIAHKGGLKNYMEVIGHGRAIPSPVAGSQLPTAETLYDGVLSGGAVTPFSGLTVEVDATTYRIDGTTYTLNTPGYVMGATPLLVMGTNPIPMGATSTFLTFDAAPTAPQSRYDLLAAGVDGAIDIVKGTAAEAPSMPATPADHIKIGHVLILGGLTTIEEKHINALIEPRKLQDFTIALATGSGTINASGEFEWHLSDNTPYCGATITMKDQYGWALSGNYTITVSLIYGTGNIGTDTITFGTSDITLTVVGGSQATFYYERNQLAATEISPVVQISITGESLQTAKRIQLLDSGGSKIA